MTQVEAGPTESHPAPLSTAEAVYHRLMERIVDGSIEPGTKLGLAELAASLGVSMQPVREALHRLEASGVVASAPHRGAWVRPVSDDDLIETFRARLLVEGALCATAAVHFTGADAEQAEEALSRQRAALAGGDRRAARIAHHDFHFALYRAARSPWLLRAAEPAWHNAERYRLAGESGSARRRPEHEALLAACVHHDAAAAEAALREHLLASVAEVDPGAAGALTG